MFFFSVIINTSYLNLSVIYQEVIPASAFYQNTSRNDKGCRSGLIICISYNEFITISNFERLFSVDLKRSTVRYNDIFVIIIVCYLKLPNHRLPRDKLTVNHLTVTIECHAAWKLYRLRSLMVLSEPSLAASAAASRVLYSTPPTEATGSFESSSDQPCWSSTL